jgi:hypothetical protein
MAGIALNEALSRPSFRDLPCLRLIHTALADGLSCVEVQGLVVQLRALARLGFQSVRHCGPMEMHDLPIRAALCNNERDTAIGTEWLSVSPAGYCVQIFNSPICSRDS